MSKSKNNKALALLCVLILAVLSATLGIFAFADTADVDANGWNMSKAHTVNALTDVDAYSSFRLDAGGVTINENELDVTEDITFSFRDKGTGVARNSTYLFLADKDKLTAWKDMTTVVAPVELKIADNVVSLNKNAADKENASWSNVTLNTTHYVTIHLSDGTSGDSSYVSVDGVQKELAQVDSGVTQSDIESGKAKLFIYSVQSRALEISSPLAPVIASVSTKNVDLTAGEATDITFDYINAKSETFTLKASQYNEDDYAFAASDYTVTPSGNNDGKGSIALKAEAIAKVNWQRNAYVSVANTNGIYRQNLTVVSGAAPSYASATAPEFKLVYGSINENVTVTFTYADKDVPVITRGYSPVDVSTRERETLTASTDYTLTASGTQYTLALKKEYLSADEQGARWYRIETKNGALEFPVFIADSDAAWITRTAKGTIGASQADANYIDLSLNGYDYSVEGERIGGVYSRAGRAFYTQALDVTKPIFIEYGSYTSGGWILFDFNDNPYGVEYCNEVKTATPSKIKILDMVANGSEQQRWGGAQGFVTNSVVGMGQYLNTYNNNVLEIYIGATAEDSYLKVNGHDLTAGLVSTGEVTICQDDFADKKAYLSIFLATATRFTMNKNVNAVAVYYPDGEPTYELKSNTDISFTVPNAGEDLTVSRAGKELVKGTDYTYDGTSGTLTVKGTYMRTIAFASVISLSLSSHGTSTTVNIPAYTGTAETEAKIADGESAVKYFAGNDLQYKFYLGSESFLNVVDGVTEDALSQSDYAYADGVLTLKASAVSSRDNGVYTFLLQTDASLVPFYVLHYGFENGYTALEDLNVSKSGATYTVAGGGALVLEKMKSLIEGVNAELTFNEVLGYYETGSPSGNADSYVAFRFYDVATGNSVVFRLRPNADDESAFIKNKLWGDIEILDANGASVSAYNTSLRLDVAGKHALGMKLEGAKLTFAVDDEPALELDLGATQIDAQNLLLSVETANGTADKQMKYTLSLGSDDVVAPQPEKKGCKGSADASFGGVGLALVLLGGAAIALRKKSARDQQ